jgi:hypothetical protein
MRVASNTVAAAPSPTAARKCGSAVSASGTSPLPLKLLSTAEPNASAQSEPSSVATVASPSARR